MIRALCGIIPTIQPTVSMQIRTAVSKRRLIRKEWFVYKPNMKSRYKGNPNPRLRMILLEDVENIGMKGDVVKVKRAIGRNNLIPNKLAIYGTYENLIKHGIDPKTVADDVGSKVPINVLNYLKRQEINLVIPDTEDVHEETKDNWVITRHDVIEYFWRHGHLVVPINCIKLFGCGDNIIRETGSYTAEVTLNNTMTIPVPINVREKEDISDEDL